MGAANYLVLLKEIALISSMWKLELKEDKDEFSRKKKEGTVYEKAPNWKGCTWCTKNVAVAQRKVEDKAKSVLSKADTSALSKVREASFTSCKQERDTTKFLCEKGHWL